MAKATGKIIDLHVDYTNVIIGDTVTIELPKGMKVIGTCSTCAEHQKPAIDLKCVLQYGFEYEPAKFGCRNWKLKKGARG